MAYNPTSWKDHIKDSNGNVVQQGTPVNSVNLNKLEQGIVQTNEDMKLKIGKGEVVRTDLKPGQDAYRWDINDLNEATRALIMNMTPGEINAVLGIANVVAENIANNAVTMPKLAGATKGKNLFDKDAATVDYYVQWDNGNLGANTNYYASDWIPVTPNTAYARNYSHQTAFYDVNKVYISGINLDVTKEYTNLTFTTPANAYYMRETVRKGYETTHQVELGTAVTAFEAYGYKVPKLVPTLAPQSVGDVQLKGGSVGDTHLKAGAVKSQHLYGSVYTKNLFDKTTVTLGYFVQYGNGLLQGNPVYNASDFIPVQPSTVYTRSYSHQMAFYDVYKNYISGLSSGDTFTTPANCAYVRLTIDVNAMNTMQLELGSAKTSYAAYGVQWPSLVPTLAPVSVGNTELKSDAVGDINIKLKAVKQQHLAFATPGKNLFNKATVINGAFIGYADGSVITPHATYCASDWIPVEANTAYTFTQLITQHYAFFDVNKKWIGPATNGGATTNGNVVTTPSNCAYMRVTCTMSVVNTAQIEKGSVGTPYEPYGFFIDTLQVKEAQLNDGAVGTTKIADKAVKSKHFYDATPGKNLFNKDTRTVDKYVNFQTGGLDTNTSYDASDYIPVKPNTQYSYSAMRMIAWYDADKVFISGAENGPLTITSPANAAYIRVSIAKAALATFQLEEGNIPTAYEPYGFKLTGLIIDANSASLDPKRALGPVDVVVPRKTYILKDNVYKFFTRNMIKSLSPLLNLDMSAAQGKQLANRYEVTPAAVGSFDLSVSCKDMHFTEFLKKSTNIEVVDLSNTNEVNLLAIGDSITRGGGYVKWVQDNLPNVKTLGTRQYSGETFAREGRGGWTLSGYMNTIGSALYGDSPFLFPVGVPGAKFLGNTSFWKKVCFTDPNGYDFQGFQRMAKGWTGTSYIFDANGYPITPAVDDVVVDPTQAAGATWRIYNGTAWVAMSPQPAIEFSFTKYMERYAPAFEGKVPNVVSFLLATNDFAGSIGIEGGIETFISSLRTAVASIRAYNPNIKVIFNMPMLGNGQDQWGNASNTGTTDFQFNRNMQDVALRLVKEFDTDTELANKNYVCAMGSNVDVANITDQVHPNDAGHADMGRMMGALIQKIR